LLTLTQDRAGRGWVPSAFSPILTQALGGIVVGLITKRLGGISKGFAVVGGLSITGGIQCWQAGRLMSPELCLAWVLVVSR
jgi:UDP-sugar transporter A1/2/3